MSIYATNFIVDEETGEAKLIKRLNKEKINRRTAFTPPGGWNKKGNKQKEIKYWSKGHKKESFKSLNDQLNKTED